jgi:hypothetical protein
LVVARVFAAEGGKKKSQGSRKTSPKMYQGPPQLALPDTIETELDVDKALLYAEFKGLHHTCLHFVENSDVFVKGVQKKSKIQRCK